MDKVVIDDTWIVELPDYDKGESGLPKVLRHNEFHHDANNVEASAARNIAELQFQNALLAAAVVAAYDCERCDCWKDNHAPAIELAKGLVG